MQDKHEQLNLEMYFLLKNTLGGPINLGVWRHQKANDICRTNFMDSISQLTLDEETRKSINCLHYKNRYFLDGDIPFKDQEIENDDVVVFTDQTNREIIIGVIEASSKAQMEREENGR
ncbi:MAG: hypothetical protein NUV86_05300 [Candidatus Scalindua sp.]|nr:hypothetical protein [Candidatus Scalindua sp.]MCR4344275.1 hypothetical protein [Candidatus Scalindua sp.]